jgi:hypothetical protein
MPLRQAEPDAAAAVSGQPGRLGEFTDNLGPFPPVLSK